MNDEVYFGVMSEDDSKIRDEKIDKIKKISIVYFIYSLVFYVLPFIIVANMSILNIKIETEDEYLMAYLIVNGIFLIPNIIWCIYMFIINNKYKLKVKLPASFNRGLSFTFLNIMSMYYFTAFGSLGILLHMDEYFYQMSILGLVNIVIFLYIISLREDHDELDFVLIRCNKKYFYLKTGKYKHFKGDMTISTSEGMILNSDFILNSPSLKKEDNDFMNNCLEYFRSFYNSSSDNDFIKLNNLKILKYNERLIYLSYTDVNNKEIELTLPNINNKFIDNFNK